MKGRGAGFDPENRFSEWVREAVDDGWGGPSPAAAIRTTLTPDASRSVISWNRSPDIPVDRSLNPYRGCEHGCVYCYARPTHAWLGLSPGVEFESRLSHKADAPALLAKELGKPGYLCRPMALSGNTDPYQPAERRLNITRRVLQTLLAHRHPAAVAVLSGNCRFGPQNSGPMVM